MLSNLVKESKARRAEIATENGAATPRLASPRPRTPPHCSRCRADRLKREAMESVGAATTAAMDAVNLGVATVWHLSLIHI